MCEDRGADDFNRAKQLIYALKCAYDGLMTPSTLTHIRQAEHESINSFSKRLGISRNTLGNYEAGKQPIPKYIVLAATAIYRRLEDIGEINNDHS